MRIEKEFSRVDYGHTHKSTAYSDDGGQTWKWASNDAYCPVDACKLYGIPCNVQKQTEARDEEARAFLAEYRKNWQPPTGEQLAEMTAAFGEDVELVDVAAGRKFRTPKYSKDVDRANNAQIGYACQRGFGFD